MFNWKLNHLSEFAVNRTPPPRRVPVCGELKHMINLDKTVQEIYDYFHPELREDVEDLEKDYISKVSALLSFCELVEMEWEQCKTINDSHEALRRLANQARDFLAEEGR